jgi:hypothetical protein
MPKEKAKAAPKKAQKKAQKKAPALANAVPAGKISKEEQKWRAESDARTLLDAVEIKNDKARLAKAQAIAARKAADFGKVAKE